MKPDLYPHEQVLDYVDKHYDLLTVAVMLVCLYVILYIVKEIFGGY